MKVVISIWILGLKSEDPSIGRSVEFDHSLHGQGSVDKVRGLVINILDPDDDSLVVSV